MSTSHDNPAKSVLQFFQEVLFSSSDSDDEANIAKLKSLDEVLQSITFSQLEIKEDSQGKEQGDYLFKFIFFLSFSFDSCPKKHPFVLMMVSPQHRSSG